MDAEQNQHLRRYLTDHWAAAGGGVSLMRRIAQENDDTRWANELQRISEQIAEDDEALGHIRDSLGITRGKVRRTLATAAEHASRVKLNGRVLSYSPLSRVEEAEAMISAVMAKQQLWETLHSQGLTNLAPLDLDQLIARADGQMTSLKVFHQWSVEQAFGAPIGSNGLSAR